MRNSFELLDWLKQHLGGSGGGPADVPSKAEATAEINGITNPSTAGTAKCIQGATGVIATLNLKVTAKPNEGFVTFPLHDARFSTARFPIYAAGGAYVVSGADGNLTIYTTAALSGKSVIGTIAVPYF